MDCSTDVSTQGGGSAGVSLSRRKAKTGRRYRSLPEFEGAVIPIGAPWPDEGVPGPCIASQGKQDRSGKGRTDAVACCTAAFVARGYIKIC